MSRLHEAAEAALVSAGEHCCVVHAVEHIFNDDEAEVVIGSIAYAATRSKHGHRPSRREAAAVACALGILAGRAAEIRGIVKEEL